MIKKIFLIIYFLPIIASAQSSESKLKFSTEDWSKGLHIFVGAGLNSSNFLSNSRKNYLGIGGNFKTDVNWFFSHDWAIESSASVKFNRLNEDLIWDTLFTIGGRHRIEEYYFQGFVGAGVLVIVLDENTPSANSDTRRLHMDGPALGLGIGRTQKTEAGKVWFIELNGTVQVIKHRDAVAVDGQYPIAISSQEVTDNSTIYSLQFTIGVMLL